MIRLDPEPLSAAAFAPFGAVIEAMGPALAINQGTTERFDALAKADVEASGGRAALSIFRARARARPIELRLVERHPLGSQAFVPLAPEPWLVVVAAGEAPGPEDLRAFRASGAQGVQYARGVWHHPLLILAETQDFLVVDREGPPGEGARANLEERWFGRPPAMLNIP